MRKIREIGSMHTQLLTTALSVSWKQHMANEELYGKLPKITDSVCESALLSSLLEK